MAVLHSPNSRGTHELMKWEQHHTSLRAVDAEGNDIPLGNPYVFRPYPRMLYKARKDQGVIRCLDPQPDPLGYEKPDQYQRALDRWDRDNRSATCIVNDEGEHKAKRDQGWRDSQPEALAHLQGLEDDMARANAEAAHSVRRMSEKAQTEFAAAEASTSEFVADVPRKPGRPKKVVT